MFNELDFCCMLLPRQNCCEPFAAVWRGQRMGSMKQADFVLLVSSVTMPFSTQPLLNTTDTAFALHSKANALYHVLYSALSLNFQPSRTFLHNSVAEYALLGLLLCVHGMNKASMGKDN